jgi:hypothetical protein
MLVKHTHILRRKLNSFSEFKIIISSKHICSSESVDLLELQRPISCAMVCWSPGTLVADSILHDTLPPVFFSSSRVHVFIFR